MVDLDNFITTNNIGYAHSFGEKIILKANMLETLEKSKTENKFKATITLNCKQETIDYLTSKDILALRDGKRIECVWVKSRSGKPYWNHSSVYLDEEVLA